MKLRQLFSPWSVAWSVLRALAVGAVACGVGLALRGFVWVGVLIFAVAAVGLFLAHEIPRRGELRAIRKLRP